jgi:hypothetical protein
MKMILIFLVSTFVVAAQTNLTFDLLITRQGEFQNATIIRTNAAYIIVNHATGIAKIAMTNLSPWLQEKLGYDPVAASNSIAAEKKHDIDLRQAKIDRQKYIASLAGAPQSVRCVSILQYGLCELQTTNGVIKAYIGVPDNVRNFLVRYDQLESGITSQEQFATQRARAADRADANAPVAAEGDAAYVNAAMAQRQQANNMVVDANQAADDLANMKSEFKLMDKRILEATTFTAFPTGTFENGIPRWQAMQ